MKTCDLPWFLPVVLALSVMSASCSRQEGPGIIRLSGNIEATEVVVGFKIPGRLMERCFDEGHTVVKNALTARLDDADLKHQVDLARANLSVARANLSELLAGSRPQEIAEAKAAMDQAQADMQNKGRDVSRMEQLYQKGGTSRKACEDAQTACRMAEEAFRRAQEGYSLRKEGPRKEDIAAARARVEASEAALRIAETNLGYAAVYSPISGVVLSKAAEPGEVLAPGRAVLTIGDLDHLWLRAYVDERDLGRIKWGQEAAVSTDTYPGKTYKGRVSYISSQAEFTPKSVQTEKERVTLVYRIKVDLDNGKHELKPGMIADCEIKTGQ